MIMAKKGYNYSLKKKIPLILLLNLFGIFIIPQFAWFVNIFGKVSKKYLPRAKKAEISPALLLNFGLI